MLDDLMPAQRELALFMSHISERTWFATWMDGLEYELWRALKAPTATVGCRCLTPSELDGLRQLSDMCGGWITFEGAREEAFVPLPEWVTRFEAWATRTG
jgi:hypothetical protein